MGTRSPSSPKGSADRPVNAVKFALGAGARFVARSYDVAQKHMVETLTRAHGHDGTSFVEILQNCIVYNDGVFEDVTDKKAAANAQVHVKHGEPLLFGEENSRGLRLNPASLALEAVTIGEGGVLRLTTLLFTTKPIRRSPGCLPVWKGRICRRRWGVIYCAPDAELAREGEAVDAPEDAGDRLNTLMRQGHTWHVA